MSYERGPNRVSITILIFCVMIFIGVWRIYKNTIKPDPLPLTQDMKFLSDAKRGWMIVKDVTETDARTYIVGPNVIYVVIRADQYPSCMGCHSTTEPERKIDKGILCPTWTEAKTE